MPVSVADKFGNTVTANLVREASPTLTLAVNDGGSLSVLATAPSPFKIVTTTIAGSAEVSMQRALLMRRDVSADGLAAVSAAITAMKKRDATASGAATVSQVSSALKSRAVSADGLAAVSLSRSATKARSTSIIGLAAPSLLRATWRNRALTAAGVAAASMVGEVVTPFDPASLFGSGDEGILHDFSNKSSLFTDLAGTTAVTASGDPVGYATDLGSGNNNTAAPFTSARGTYTESGGLAGLFIGAASGERLEANNAAGVTGLTNVNECTMMVAYTTHTDPGSVPLRLGTTAADYAEVRHDARLGSIRDPSVGITVDNASSADTSGAAFVYGGIKEGAEGRWYRWNSAGGGLAETDTGLGTFAADFSADIEVRGNGSTIYAVMFINRALTTTEFNNARDWFRARAGH